MKVLVQVKRVVDFNVGSVEHRLNALLTRLPHSEAMNLETLDGFFAALHGSPEPVAPSEYLPMVWGGHVSEEEAEEAFTSTV